MSKQEAPIADHKELRKSLGLNQSEYWNPLGVEQSSGSRYESGKAAIPVPVQKLAIMVWRKKHKAPELRA